MPIDTARFSPRATTLRPQADRSGRLLLAAGVSTYGDWLTVVALAVLLFRLTHEPQAPALYVLFKVAPRVLGPTPGGYLADRFGPGRVAGWSALAQSLLTGAIVISATAGAVWAIFAAVAVAQFLGSMAQPGYSACIPRVTRPDRLLRVNAIYSGLFESSVLTAPAIGALVLTVVQPEVLIAGDAASFFVAGALMLSLRVGRAPRSFTPAARAASAAGLVFRDPMLRSLAASFFCSAVLVTALQGVLVVAAAERFGQDTRVGFLYAAVGAGGVAGSLALLRWRPPPIGTGGITLAFLLENVPLGVFALVGGLIPALALLAFSTAVGALYQTRGQTALQQRTPAEILGRVNGVMRLLLYAGMLAGAVVAVTLVDVLGWSTLVAGTTIAAIALYLVVVVTLQLVVRTPDEVALSGTPVPQFSDQTASVRASRSRGRPADLPQSLQDQS